MQSRQTHRQCPTDALGKIISPHLLSYITDIVFPWPHNDHLDGSEVGNVFFRENSRSLWNTYPIKDALVHLSRMQLEQLSPERIVAAIRSQIEIIQTDQQQELQYLEKVCAVLLLLDQGSRNLFRGTNARYTYHHFDVAALSLARHLVSLPSTQTPFLAATWMKAGLHYNHAALRVAMLMAPLCHSEDLTMQRLHLSVTEDFRSEYETLSGTADPHRRTKRSDMQDIYLMADLLKRGPPQGQDVVMPDFVYWIMRYFTSHVAYVNAFQRSPFRNVAVGRDDAPGEAAWLQKYDIVWTEADEIVREQIKKDRQNHRWTPLDLDLDIEAESALHISILHN